MRMIKIWMFIAFNLVTISASAQIQSAKRFNFFNRTEVSYSLAINEVLGTSGINAFRIKTIFGKQNNFFGIGAGISTASFNTIDRSGGGNYNTISFLADAHAFPFKNEDSGNNIFVKAAAGYSPRVFNGYNQGFTYDAGLGYIITTKKGGRLFIQALYLQQNLSQFNFIETVKLQSVGLGVGVGF
ncbi:hypothetical protein PBAC_22950 [Pedobacter glucosidilyticus]|nr:hypothetical protein [Pedobacter glucosidilyticus]KHJ37577.1 hypothetical protein PBAC_22950 [Pedobacter glucosidilyticus]